VLSSSQNVTTNKPTPIFTGQMSFLSPTNSAEGNYFFHEWGMNNFESHTSQLSEEPRLSKQGAGRSLIELGFTSWCNWCESLVASAKTHGQCCSSTPEECHSTRRTVQAFVMRECSFSFVSDYLHGSVGCSE